MYFTDNDKNAKVLKEYERNVRALERLNNAILPKAKKDGYQSYTVTQSSNGEAHHRILRKNDSTVGIVPQEVEIDIIRDYKYSDGRLYYSPEYRLSTFNHIVKVAHTKGIRTLYLTCANNYPKVAEFSLEVSIDENGEVSRIGYSSNDPSAYTKACSAGGNRIAALRHNTTPGWYVEDNNLASSLLSRLKSHYDGIRWDNKKVVPLLVTNHDPATSNAIEFCNKTGYGVKADTQNLFDTGLINTLTNFSTTVDRKFEEEALLPTLTLLAHSKEALKKHDSLESRAHDLILEFSRFIDEENVRARTLVLDTVVDVARLRSEDGNEYRNRNWHEYILDRIKIICDSASTRESKMLAIQELDTYRKGLSPETRNTKLAVAFSKFLACAVAAAIIAIVVLYEVNAYQSEPMDTFFGFGIFFAAAGALGIYSSAQPPSTQEFSTAHPVMACYYQGRCGVLADSIDRFTEKADKIVNEQVQPEVGAANQPLLAASP